MRGVLNTDSKFKINDIANGLAKVDIFDNRGSLLVAKGNMLREEHYRRLREDGLIPCKDRDAKCAPNQHNIDYSPPDSVHSRLNLLISAFSGLQKRIVTQPADALREDLLYICDTLIELCEESIYQVLGELYLSDAHYYAYTKPLYIAASLNELVQRYNEYYPQQVIDLSKKYRLLQAALLHNLGLLISEYPIYRSKIGLSDEQRAKIRKNYPVASALLATKMGITDSITLDAIRQHNTESRKPSLEAQLLRMPFVYAGIAMNERPVHETEDIMNPTREFTRLFSQNRLDPVLGGLFLKINGLAPVGAILIFSNSEQAVIIAGPNESSIASSTLRMITHNNGVQLGKPGDTFRLDRTDLEQKGLYNHQLFAWSKFSPFVAWEK